MSRRTPVITGSGIICAAGCGVAAVWESVRANRSGLGPLTLFSSPRYANHLVGQVRENVDELAGNVRGSRSDKLAWIAAREALAAAGLASGLGNINPARVGVMLGATVGGMLGTEKFLTALASRKQTPLRPAALSRMRRRGGFVRQTNRRARPGGDAFHRVLRRGDGHSCRRRID